ncbi:MAG: vWA domain-containing protein [Candidatus Omnitrophota bacterium]
MGLKKEKKATANTPQVVTLIIDDSESMSWDNNKAGQATQSVQDLVIQMQSWNQQSSGFRYLLNIAKFGDDVTPIAEAALPGDIDLSSLTFRGESGTTQMATALKWAYQAIQKSLNKCRQVPRYIESDSPNPLVIFFSDGENSDDTATVIAEAQNLKSIPFQTGEADVVAVGIGMDQSHFEIMKDIASDVDLAVNIDPDKLGDFISEAAQTIGKSESPKKLVDQFES